MGFELERQPDFSSLVPKALVKSLFQPMQAAPRAAEVAEIPHLANLVLPGDFPDPTVCRIGDAYYASATSSEWGPIFPLLKSYDLVNWHMVGHVFPAAPPAWAVGSFWAPEISHENGKTYICYTARRKDGRLCVAMASAHHPEGPYQDHGPLIGQEEGSIDGMPFRDENGELYLVWKLDGNAYKKDTPIYAQRLSEDYTHLLGDTSTELFRNDTKWEGCLVEGSALVRNGDYFYMFYAGNGCCGKCCTYATGVARAKSLLGPWEKHPRNPILRKNKTWACPGHGTPVEHEGRWFLLHHAYHVDTHEYVGRQGMFSEFVWKEDGWPGFIGGSPQARPHGSPSELDWADEFYSQNLLPDWEWPVNQRPELATGEGRLLLRARPTNMGSLLGRRTHTRKFQAMVKVDLVSLPTVTQAGLGIVGNVDNALGILATPHHISLVHTRSGKVETLGHARLRRADFVYVRMTCRQAFSFSWSYDGEVWQEIEGKNEPIDGSHLPPWDLGLRIGLMVKGPEVTVAAFSQFSVIHF